MKSRLLILSCLMLFVSFNVYAQDTQDALRLGEPGYGISARSVGMGNAMTGLAQGYDATYYNPAGLAQSRQSQVEMGINFLGYNNDASYLGNQNSLSSSQTDLSNLGIVYPFPTIRGSFVIAFGYNHSADFNSALSVIGFNPNSSIIPSLYSQDTAADIAYMDYLEAYDGTPYVTGNVNQTGQVRTSGGVNNWLASAGMDIAHGFSIGLTLNLISGKYKYQQNFTETAVPPDNYDSTYFESFVYGAQDNQDINGWNAKFGMMYRLEDDAGNTIARFGATIQFPSVLNITDNYGANGTATFGAGPFGAAGAYSWYTTNGYGQNEIPGQALQYDVTTPYKFSLGVSGGTSQLTAAASIEYVDWTELQFSNFNVPGSNKAQTLNTEIDDSLTATTSVRAGIEYALSNPNYSLLVPYLRAGVEYIPSAKVNSGSSQAQKILSGGVGVKIQNSIELDLAYQYGWWDTTSPLYYATYSSTQTYPGASTSNEKITNTNVMFTFQYDF